jgi:protein-L-isoaspartate(D-aspartate) O-methyltransferase
MTTIDLALRRQFFAEDIQATCNLQTPALVEALACVPREAFLKPGPWMVAGEGMVMTGPRQTPDADPRHLYHNLSVGIDPPRQLFNGAPGVVAVMIDALRLEPGARVLHVGAGWGYYSAVIAHCVGPSGRVVALEVDEALATQARANLAPWPTVEIRHDDASGPLDGVFDAMLFSAGVTHPRDAWLDALAPGGRIVLPLTVSFAGSPMPGALASATIGKGAVVAIGRHKDGDTWDARVVTMIAIYSALGVRDETMTGRLGEALKRNPFPRLTRLRRDAHEPDASCWLHGETACLQTA